MNKKEYYGKVVESMNGGIAELREMKVVYDNLVSKYKSNNYTVEHKAQRLKPEIDAMKHRIDEKKEQISSEIKKINSEYAGILRSEDALNPNDITEDSKLLTAGVPLTARDLHDIVNRNPGNRTMAQLCVRYGKANNVEGFNYTDYIPSEKQVATLNALEYASDVVLKHFDNQTVYDQLIGEGSDFANWCNE